ncbi:MAG: tyrosine-type recombinase/integrase [Candidatus Paceibacterota bacterium]
MATTHMGEFFEDPNNFQKDEGMNYGPLLETFASWCEQNGAQVTSMDKKTLSSFRRFLRGKYTDKTTDAHLRKLHHFFAWFQKKGVIPSNPLQPVLKPRGKKGHGIQVPSMSEVLSIPTLIAEEGRQATEALCNLLHKEIASPSTRYTYAVTIHQLSSWCNLCGLKLGDLNEKKLIEYKDSELKKFTVAVIKGKLRQLHRIFECLIDAQVLITNPLTNVPVPKRKTYKLLAPVLSINVVQELLTSIGSDTQVDLRDRAMCAILYHAMTTAHEARALNVKDLACEEIDWWLTVGAKVMRRRIPVNQELRRCLTEYLHQVPFGSQPNHPLFPCALPGKSGKLLGRRLGSLSVQAAVARRWKTIGYEAEHGATAAGLRVAGISRYLNTGGSLTSAAMLTGLSVGSLKKYVSEHDRPIRLFAGDLASLVEWLRGDHDSSDSLLREVACQQGIFRLTLKTRDS